MSDTVLGRQTHPLRTPAETVAVPRRSRSQWMALAAFAVGLGGCAAHGPAAPGPRVVWVHGDRAYVASRDSLALAPGDSVGFTLRGQPVARGVVSAVGQAEMATVSIASGSLAGVKDPGRLAVSVQHPSLRPMALLRVGYPSTRRTTLFFACGQAQILAPGPDGAYGTTRVSERVARFARDSSVAGSWPDTLEARLFDDAADEEIALEIGELDVAVFWPGELSAHMRSAARWQNSLAGVRSRGVAALAWQRPPAGPDLDPHALAYLEGSTFTAMNRDLFRGDLLPRWRPESSASGTVPEGSVVPWRIEVAPACPGRLELQRSIDRPPQTRGVQFDHLPTQRLTLRLVFLDVASTPSALLNEAAATTLGGGPPASSATQGPEETRIVPLFAIRCPVVCAPELRAYVAALSADSLVNLLDCRPADRKP